MGNDRLNTTEANADLAAQDDAACYLIRKGGAWYRPNSRGYTTSAIQAGRYTLKDAEDITHPNGPVGPRDGMFYVHVSDVRDDDLAEVLRLRAEARETALQYLSDTGQMSERIDELVAANAARRVTEAQPSGAAVVYALGAAGVVLLLSIGWVAGILSVVAVLP